MTRELVAPSFLKQTAPSYEMINTCLSYMKTKNVVIESIMLTMTAKVHVNITLRFTLIFLSEMQFSSLSALVRHIAIIV